MQELQAGTILRRYKVEKTLGAGGFAITYLVVDEMPGYKCRANERLESFKKVEIGRHALKFTWTLTGS